MFRDSPKGLILQTTQPDLKPNSQPIKESSQLVQKFFSTALLNMGDPELQIEAPLLYINAPELQVVPIEPIRKKNMRALLLSFIGFMLITSLACVIKDPVKNPPKRPCPENFIAVTDPNNSSNSVCIPCVISGADNVLKCDADKVKRDSGIDVTFVWVPTPVPTLEPVATIDCLETTKPTCP